MHSRDPREPFVCQDVTFADHPYKNVRCYGLQVEADLFALYWTHAGLVHTYLMDTLERTENWVEDLAVPNWASSSETLDEGEKIHHNNLIESG